LSELTEVDGSKAPLEELDDTTQGLEVGTGPVDCIDCEYLYNGLGSIFIP
jgi:hypothetical protein